LAHFRVHCVGAAILLLCVAAFAPASSADAPVPVPQVTTSTSQAQIATEDYLRRRAAVLLIRAMFDVLPRDSVSLQLGQDLYDLGADGPSEQDQLALDADLLAEGSYLIVSLRYLVQGGGALWPPAESQEGYETEALKRLHGLQADLSRMVDERDDPLPLLLDLDEIYALTEGYASIPPELDHFGQRDALVQQAIAASGTRVDL
jgi:hypothetical protein